MFKAFARALRVACAKDARLAKMLPSTKGLSPPPSVIAPIHYKAWQPDLGSQGADVSRRGFRPCPETTDGCPAGARGIIVPGVGDFSATPCARRPVARHHRRSRARRHAAPRHLRRHAVAVRGQRRGARRARPGRAARADPAPRRRRRAAASRFRTSAGTRSSSASRRGCSRGSTPARRSTSRTRSPRR